MHAILLVIFSVTNMDAHAHAGSLMNKHVAVKHPQAWIICQEPNHYMSAARYGNRVLPQRVFQVLPRRRSLACERIDTAPATKAIRTILR